MLDHPDIDIVYNPLPNHLHAEWSINAMRAGKHVLCEKPLALEAAEVDQMAKTANETGRVLAEAFMYRHHPQTLKAKDLVQSGRLGDLRFLRGAFTFTLTREQDYRWNPAMGGGSLWDVGCYPINFIRHLVGTEPLEVFGWQVLDPRGCDETFIGQLRFPGDVMAQIDCSFRSSVRTEMQMVGSRGILSIPQPFKPGRNGRLLITENDRVDTIRTPGQKLYLGEVEDMYDAIETGRAPRVSLDDSRGNTATIQALLTSARSGKPIAV
jgi:predicted dehydrogenase